MTCICVLVFFVVCCLVMGVSAVILGGRRDKDIPPLPDPTEDPEP